MSTGDDGNTSEGRSKGRRELSTSKRAAQNRAAQVGNPTRICHERFAKPGSALSGNARKNTLSSSRIKSRSLSSYANCTRRSRPKTINCAITSSTFNHDCSRRRARFHLRLLAWISTGHMASHRARTSPNPSPSPNPSHRSMFRNRNHRNHRRAVRTARTVVFLSARLVSFRWRPRQRRQPSTAPQLTSIRAQTLHTSTEAQISVRRSQSLRKVSFPRLPPISTWTLISREVAESKPSLPVE